MPIQECAEWICGARFVVWFTKACPGARRGTGQALPRKRKPGDSHGPDGGAATHHGGPREGEDDGCSVHEGVVELQPPPPGPALTEVAIGGASGLGPTLAPVWPASAMGGVL
jgi:hypothetical protein